jgi:hypothetical protein
VQVSDSYIDWFGNLEAIQEKKRLIGDGQGLFKRKRKGKGEGEGEGERGRGSEGKRERPRNRHTWGISPKESRLGLG